MSTSPPTNSTPSTIISVPGIVCASQAPTADYTPTTADYGDYGSLADYAPSPSGQGHETEILKSMLGAVNLPSGEELDALLAAAAQDVYED